MFQSYLVITLDQAILFMDPAKLTDDVEDYLKAVGVDTRDYNDLWSYLRKREWGEGKVSVLAYILVARVFKTWLSQGHSRSRGIVRGRSHANPFPIHRVTFLRQLHESDQERHRD